MNLKNSLTKQFRTSPSGLYNGVNIPIEFVQFQKCFRNNFSVCIKECVSMVTSPIRFNRIICLFDSTAYGFNCFGRSRNVFNELFDYV